MNHFEKFNQWILDHQNKGKIQVDHAKGQFGMSVVTKNDIPTGVDVTNLSEPILPISVFHGILYYLQIKGGKAIIGNARDAKLGEELCPTDSVEGFIATILYQKEEGTYVLARRTPVSRILEKAGVCGIKSGYLYLV